MRYDIPHSLMELCIYREHTCRLVVHKWLRLARRHNYIAEGEELEEYQGVSGKRITDIKLSLSVRKGRRYNSCKHVQNSSYFGPKLKILKHYLMKIFFFL
jgi:hypothetical protein